MMSGKAIDRTDVDRETLEQMALEACPAELFYELSDQLGEVEEDVLLLLVNYNQDEESPIILEQRLKETLS